jgi:hypothetical protein
MRFGRITHNSRPHALRRFRRAMGYLCSGLVVALLPACELAEVGTEPGRDLVVVEAILRAGVDHQIVILHRSIVDGGVRGEPGADVKIIGPLGEEYTFVETSLGVCADGITLEDTDSIDVRASCYINPVRAGLSVVRGTTYELRVVTSDGRKIRGRTTIPGRFQLRSVPATRTGIDCSLPPDTNLPLVWSVSDGAWSYVAAMRITGLREALAPRGIKAPDRLELTGVAISETDTTLVVPAEIGLFELGDVNQEILKVLQNGFPAGVSVDLTIAAVDRNYVNAVRGGGFNPSGNVRISSVVGDGVGVFASIFPRDLQIQVGNDLPYPPCLRS